MIITINIMMIGNLTESNLNIKPFTSYGTCGYGP